MYKVTKVFVSETEQYYAVINTGAKTMHSAWVLWNTANTVKNDLNAAIKR